MQRRLSGGIATLLTSLFLLATWTPPIAAEKNLSGWRVVGQIGGPTQAVAVQGNYAYVGVGLRLVVLDVSNPATLQEVGNTAPFPHFVEGVVVSGTRSYVAAGDAGLRVVDISNPARPTEIGAWDSPGYAEGVAVAGSTVYLADGPYGLWVVDVSDPARPTKVGSAYDMNYAFDVVVAGHYAYIAAAGAGLLIADVSDSAHPIEVGSLDTPGYAYGVAVSGTTVYVADGWEGLRVVDISNPISPTTAGVCHTPGWALSVVAAGSVVYVAAGANGLRVVDVVDRSNPYEVGSYRVSSLARRLAATGSKAYVADQRGGLQVISAADPAHPTQVGLYSPLADARRVTVAGSYAYVAAGFSGLRVVDVSNPTRPKEVGAYDTKGGYASSVVVSGTYAYLAAYISGPNSLHVVNISDPAHPARVGSITTDGAYREIALVGQIVYVADEWGLRLISVSDPTIPTQIGFIQLNQAQQDTVGVAVSGTLAYLADALDGVKIVDVSNPFSPTLVGVYDSPGFTQGVAVVGNRAYAADSQSGLRVVDVANPNQPTEIGFYDTPGVAESVMVVGPVAYVSDGGGGVQMVNVSNPSAPTLVGAYDTPGFAWYTTLAGNYAYVADGHGGLLILEQMNTDVMGKSGDTPAYRPSRVVGGADSQSQTGARGTPVTPRFSTSQGQVVKDMRQDERHIASAKTGLTAVFASSCVVTSAADSGAGTLRQCLFDAKGGDTIAFDPSVFPPTSPVSISPITQLPTLTQGNLTIDASNAGVILDGSQALTGTVGLVVDSAGNTIKGVQVLHFPANGILLTNNASHNTIGGDRLVGKGPTGEGNVISANGRWSGLQVYGADNVVQGNLIGTDATGSVALGNAVSGLCLEGPRNLVGGIAAGKRNVISGNGDVGICIQSAGTISNTIIGNFVGTDATGTLALGNPHGITISGNASYNRVGGATPDERNIISGNTEKGISIIGLGVEGNTVTGNYIGTDVSGTRILGNGRGGVIIESGASNNVVGGTVPAERNVISGNRGYGVIISDPSSTHNAIIGNFIGTDATGTAALANNGGVLIWTSGFNRIGGPRPEEKNLISGNNGYGISLGGLEMSDNLILGNYIGTDVTGARPFGNGTGININEGTRHNFVGGTTAGERNIISGNSVGVRIENAGIEYNWVAGNYIGTSASGTSALGNGWAGVSLEDYALHNFIQSNTIAHNSAVGVRVTRSPYNTIRRNSIHSNAGKGIENMNGGNNMLPAPVIISVTSTSVSGTTCPGCTVEVFSDAEDEGRVYEGSTIADASGVFTFTKASGLTGPYLTATVTNRDGDTSAFSAPPRLTCLDFADPPGVGVEDIQVVASRWRQSADPPYDLDGDRIITIVDIMKVSARWGEACSTTATAWGMLTFTKASGLTGPYVTATATDLDGNTSEFSTPQRVWRKWIYLPMILNLSLELHKMRPAIPNM